MCMLLCACICVHTLYSQIHVSTHTVHRTKKGMTALHIACQLNHVDSVAKLVHAGADTKARDNANKTPLDYVFHDNADPHANPFYNYLHALLMDDLSAQKNRIQNLRDKIETRYATMEARVGASTGQPHSHGGAQSSVVMANSNALTTTMAGNKTQRAVTANNTGNNSNAASMSRLRHFSITVDEKEAQKPEDKDSYASLERRGLVRVLVGGSSFTLRRSKLIHRKGCRLTEALEQLDALMGSSASLQAAGSVSGNMYTLSCATGDIVVDRSPDVFRRVVQFLDGDLTMPDSRDELAALRDDADFYGLPGLRDKCELQLARLHMRRVGGPGGHASIADAVAAAEEGEQIVVCGGTYAEAITITKSITLLADRAADKRVVITGDTSGEPSVRIKAGSVLLVGMHITWQSGRQDPGRGCCVEVAGGGLALMEMCVLSGPAAYGVFVHPLGRANLQKVKLQVNARVFILTCYSSWKVPRTCSVCRPEHNHI